MKDKSLFAFAGIWDTIKEGEKEIITFSIITTEPNDLIKPVHDRMPLILHINDAQKWLDTPLIDLLNPYESEKLKMYQISKKINSTKNDGVELIRPITTLDAYS
jgi:putative SOS response-associated peptidase YedK